MKIVRVVSLLFFFFLACPALAQKTAVPIKDIALPVTNNIVILACYQKAVAGWGGGKSERATRENFSEFGKAETDKFLVEFSNQMTAGGFVLVANDECKLKEDDGSINIIVKLSSVYAAFREDLLVVESMVKVPGKDLVIPAARENINGMNGIGTGEAVTRISAAVIKRVRDGQQRSTDTPSTLPEIKAKTD
ncbi:MAG: hypothetical protein Q8P23_04005 [bacterium]|nr:hypothetical protein [bacterium]